MDKLQEYLDIVRKDHAIAEVLEIFCDIIFYEKFQEPDNEEGHMKWNMKGSAFASDGAGGEYVALEDGTIGYHSSEGEAGRLAENVQEFFRFIVNLSYWRDFCDLSFYSSQEKLNECGKRIRKEQIQNFHEDHVDFQKLQKKLAEKFGVMITEDLGNVLNMFYKATTRSPQYEGCYHEEDGETTPTDALLQEWV